MMTANPDTVGKSNAEAISDLQVAMTTRPIVKHGTLEVPSILPNQEWALQVQFDKPMPDTSYSVAISPTVGGSYWASLHFVSLGKTTTGFQIIARLEAASASGITYVDWIAVR